MRAHGPVAAPCPTRASSIASTNHVSGPTHCDDDAVAGATGDDHPSGDRDYGDDPARPGAISS
jgi:hypothetical protein